jgi:hypothetical protein
MRRIILAPIPVSSAPPPARAQAPNSINTIARGMRASGCIPSTRETAGSTLIFLTCCTGFLRAIGLGNDFA